MAELKGREVHLFMLEKRVQDLETRLCDVAQQASVNENHSAALHRRSSLLETRLNVIENACKGIIEALDESKQ